MNRLRRNLSSAMKQLSWPMIGAIAFVIGSEIPAIAREPQVILGKRWPVDQRLAIDKVDHQQWNRLVKAHVDAKGNVDYASWSGKRKDVAALDAYLADLSRADSQLEASRSARLAFWINAYNAVVIQVLLDQPPSPEQHRALPERVWTDWVLQVGDQQFSLDAIENEQLRKLRDPRIHFALVCGAKGCPRLRDEAYTAEDLDAQLSQNSCDFFADSTKFAFDPATNRLKLSPILKWHAEDFGDDSAGRLKSIVPYLPEAARQGVEKAIGLQVDFLEYDSELNAQPSAEPPKATK